MFLPGLLLGLVSCWHRGILKTVISHPSIVLLPAFTNFTFTSSTTWCKRSPKEEGKEEEEEKGEKEEKAGGGEAGGRQSGGGGGVLQTFIVLGNYFPIPRTISIFIQISP